MCHTRGCSNAAHHYGPALDSGHPEAGRQMRCKECKRDDDVYNGSYKCRCCNTASYGPAHDSGDANAGKRVRCKECKTDDDVCNNGSKCASCKLVFVAKRGDRCANCGGGNANSVWYNAKCNMTVSNFEQLGVHVLAEDYVQRGVCDEQSGKKFARIDMLLTNGDKSCLPDNMILAIECNEHEHQRDMVLTDGMCDTARIMAIVSQLKLKYGGDTSIVIVMWNCDLGHSRSDATRETEEEKTTLLACNQILLFRALAYIKASPPQTGSATLLIIGYSDDNAAKLRDNVSYTSAAGAKPQAQVRIECVPDASFATLPSMADTPLLTDLLKEHKSEAGVEAYFAQRNRAWLEARRYAKLTVKEAQAMAQVGDAYGMAGSSVAVKKKVAWQNAAKKHIDLLLSSVATYTTNVTGGDTAPDVEIVECLARKDRRVGQRTDYHYGKKVVRTC